MPADYSNVLEFCGFWYVGEEARGSVCDADAPSTGLLKCITCNLFEEQELGRGGFGVC
jgi:hypothetical protein